MQIQVNTDNHIDGHEALVAHVETVVESTLRHVGDHITRVEVHLSDENSVKSGAEDKRCVMEARLKHHQPIAVTNHADNIHQAIDGAAKKLKAALDSTIGKLSDHHRNPAPAPIADE
ncbi:MAG: HPF/RaiA family ribosome-associated protein [Casimicrobiaceae bacterium]